MKIKIATYNVMNLFSRARPIAVVDDWDDNKPTLEDIVKLNEIIEKKSYSSADKQSIIEILIRNNLATLSRKDDQFRINQIRKKLYTNPSNGVINIKAAGRDSWLGWVEPVRELFSSEAIRNTARVINAVNADILCLVEVEDRLTLERFHDDVLVREGFLTKKERQYPFNMLVDGNDERGIDVGIYSRHPIKTILSHIKDTYQSNGNEYPVFSRDCPEFEVRLPTEKTIWALVNHLKSQGYGSQASNDAKRKRQAERIKEILHNKYDLTKKYVVVAGDFNDIPQSDPLTPLMNITDLHDVLKNVSANDRWTYKSGKKQFDYLLVSTPLWDKTSDVGVERRGIYQKSSVGNPIEMFPEVKGLSSQASDHGAVWAEFDL